MLFLGGPGRKRERIPRVNTRTPKNNEEKMGKGPFLSLFLPKKLFPP